MRRATLVEPALLVGFGLRVGAELAEFVARLERHVGLRFPARRVHRFGEVEVRALVSGIVLPEPQGRVP